MKIKEVADILNAKVYCSEECLDEEIREAFASDMMSDVLAYVKGQELLISGLCNPQTIRTAVMLDMKAVVLVRGKTPSPEMISLAKRNGIVLMSSKCKMFNACGKLYAGGIIPGEYNL